VGTGSVVSDGACPGSDGDRHHAKTRRRVSVPSLLQAKIIVALAECEFCTASTEIVAQLVLRWEGTDQIFNSIDMLFTLLNVVCSSGAYTPVAQSDSVTVSARTVATRTLKLVFQECPSSHVG
jgi:hypothetical protein